MAKTKAERDLYAAQHARRGGRRLAGSGRAGAIPDARRKAAVSGGTKEKARKEIKTYIGRSIIPTLKGRSFYRLKDFYEQFQTEKRDRYGIFSIRCFKIYYK